MNLFLAMSSKSGQDGLVDMRRGFRSGEACHQAGGVVQKLKFLHTLFTGIKVSGYCLYLLRR